MPPLPMLPMTDMDHNIGDGGMCQSISSNGNINLTTTTTVDSSMISKDNSRPLKHKRRYCKFEGCKRTVKSQGLCQRHGAKAKKCQVDGCDKQAQGNFDKMCKAHFKEHKRKEAREMESQAKAQMVGSAGSDPSTQPGNNQVPTVASVYDDILPASISYDPSQANGAMMPLIQHLKDGFDGKKPPAWHRNEERLARGLPPVPNPAQQLEGWERELVWMEILVLTGAPKARFRHLARAWGRDKAFHMVLAQFICERHGDVQRKKRQREAQNKSPAKRQRKPTSNIKIEDSDEALPAENPSSDVGADVWDVNCYGNNADNEALAADIFNYSSHDFEVRWKAAHTEDLDLDYEESEDASQATSAAQSLESSAAFAAILDEDSPDTPSGRDHADGGYPGKYRYDNDNDNDDDDQNNYADKEEPAPQTESSDDTTTTGMAQEQSNSHLA